MQIYKNVYRPRVTLKERLNKNKQYLQRRLLRISKRANWLKRKISKRLKYNIKSRRFKGYYNTSFKNAHYTKIIKTKKSYLKIISAQQKNHQIKQFSAIKFPVKFNGALIAVKLLNNCKSFKPLFSYYI